MRLFFKSLTVVIIFTLCGVQMGLAHRFYASFTQIDLRQKNRTIEITHRLFTHDVEDFLRSKLGNSSSLTNAEIEPVLKEFVEGSFALFDGQGVRLPLTWVAMDYEIDDVHIYQEAPLPRDLLELTIINRLFMDLFDDQKNTVNVEWNEQIRTRIFVKGNEQQKVSFRGTD
ncbi:MAG: hypothetical protein COB49_03370 [Alphaproteobacteria bacterium]|nr:MAG: hypothetical protein COB49_03370 [Alphaproteobacteria bacterium]